MKALYELSSNKLSNDEKELLYSIQNNIDSMASRLIDQNIDDAPIGIINVSKALEKIIEIKRLEYSKDHLVKITTSIKPSLSSLVNKDELSSIISNIINNSTEARKPNELISVNISAENDDDKIIIKIKDNGIGISNDTINRVFEYGLTSKKSGKGCGLFHAKNTINFWKGEIAIHSIISESTEVIISLPIASTAKDIILIDDEQLNILSWKGMAKKVGVNFKGYTTPEAFFNELPDNKNSQIYVDFDLKEKNGVDVINQLKILGFQNVFLATGHNEIIEKNIIQVGKEFPI